MKLSEIVNGYPKPVNYKNYFTDLESSIAYTLLIDYQSLIWDIENFNESSVDTKLLIPTQDYINDDFDEVDLDEPIAVFRKAGKLFVIDGHHRLAKLRKNNIAKAFVIIFDLPSKGVNDIKWFEKQFNIKLKIKPNGIIVPD